MTDNANSILRSAKRFLTGTMLSRVTGLFRDIAMAAAFGTDASIAAFLLAFRFSHLFRRMLGEGALQTAFVPAFEEIRKDSEKEAGQFFKDITVGLSLVLLFIMTLSMGALWWGADYLSPGNKEVALLTFWMMPSLFFICLYGLNAGLLQCENRYFTASFAPVAFNFVWIAGVYLCRNLETAEAMQGLSLFIIVACAGQWLMTAPSVWSIRKRLGSFSWGNPFSKNVRKVITPLFLGIIGISASQFNNVLDSLFARYADSEGPAYLWYAIRIQQMPLALIGIAISGALFPPLARAIKGGDLAQFRKLFDFALSRSVAPMIVLTAGFFVAADTVINLIYGHGHFKDHSTVETTLCLWAYGVGLIPMTMVLIMAPALYAQGKYKVTTQASVASMCLNAFLNAFLIFGMGLGAASVALATSISAWVNVWILSRELKKTISPVFADSFLRSCARIAGISLCAGVAVVLVDNILFSHASAWHVVTGSPNYTSSIMAKFLHVSMQGVVFFGGVSLLGWWFKTRDLLFFKKEIL